MTNEKITTIRLPGWMVDKIDKIKNDSLAGDFTSRSEAIKYMLKIAINTLDKK
jgi:Arc/MetJ-type ribon-helix-helix transcriptional regulator